MSDLTERLSVRRQHFMSAFDPLQHHAKREQFAIELRKAKRDQQTRKRRAIKSSQDCTRDAAGMPLAEHELLSECPNLGSSLPVSCKLQVLVTFLSAHTLTLESTQALRLVRRLFSEPSYQDSLYTPQLLTEVMWYSATKDAMLVEATWALANLTALSQKVAEDVLNREGETLLKRLLQERDPAVNEHALYALGNIIANGRQFAKRLMANYCHSEVISLLARRRDNDRILKRGSWVLSMLTKYKVDIEVARRIAEALAGLKESARRGVKRNWLCAVVNLSSMDDEHVELLYRLDFVRPVLSLFPDSSEHTLVQALLVCVNLTAGSHETTQRLLDLNILDVMQCQVSHPSSHVRVRVVEVLSNIAFGTASQVSQLLAHPLTRAVLRLCTDSSYLVRVELSQMLGNLAQREVFTHLQALLGMGVLQLLKVGLQESDTKLLVVTPP